MSEWKLLFVYGFSMAMGAFTLPIVCGYAADYALSRPATVIGGFIK